MIGASMSGVLGWRKGDSGYIPDINVPDSEKNEEWHRRFVESITNDSMNNGYDKTYAAITENYNFYNGVQDADAYKFIQEAEDGSVLPARWINYNKIKSKVDIMTGELLSRGYDIDVKAINPAANSSKLKEKNRRLIEMRMQPDAEVLNAKHGLGLGQNTQQPYDNEEELDLFMEKEYRSKSECVMRSALKWLCKKNNWDYSRFAAYRDILIAGRSFVRMDILDGKPVPRYIDPRYMVFDVNATDDFLSDATYFGEISYMGLADVANRYNISKKELKEAYQSWRNYNNGRNSAAAYPEIFVGQGSSLRVLVARATWADYKPFKYKESEDKFGNQHLKILTGEKVHKDAKKRSMKIWREGTLIGGKFLREWGIVKNMVRPDSDLHEAQCPYKAYIPNFLNYKGISKVDELKGLQELKNITLYNVQLAMARAGAKGFIYDIAQCPDDWDISQVMKYLKTAGIAFIDSNKDGTPAQFNQFQTIDMTLSQSVQQYLGINEMIDKEMKEISGINDERQGNMKASMAVGVAQGALNQSNMNTNTINKMFEEHCSRILNHMAALVKMTWVDNKDLYSPIIGDAGVDFLEEDLDLWLDEYGVFIESTPKILQDINTFHQMVQAAMQSNQISFIDAVELMMEKDPKDGLYKIKKAMKEHQKAQQQMMEQQAQMQAQQQQAQMQAQQQAEAMKHQMDVQGKMQLEDQKGQISLNNELSKIQAKGEVDKDVTNLKESRSNIGKIKQEALKGMNAYNQQLVKLQHEQSMKDQDLKANLDLKKISESVRGK